MKTKIVSFYCDIDGSNFYSAAAESMIEKCENLHIPHCIRHREFGADWISNVLAKPTFLLEMYHELKQPFLWVDIDCEILKSPAIVDKFDCDFASVKKNRLSIWDSVHYVSQSEATGDFLEEWKQRCDANRRVGSHTILKQMLRKKVIPYLKFKYLPQQLVHGPLIKIGISKENSKILYFKNRPNN